MSLRRNRWCFSCSVSTAASSREAAGITATEFLMNTSVRIATPALFAVDAQKGEEKSWENI